MRLLSMRPAGEGSNCAYRPEIDGLRALAICAVIANHFSMAALPGGYLGVDIFFVISGHVITASLFRRPATSFTEFMSGFYARRIKRLTPALALCIAVTSLLVCLFSSTAGVSLKTAITALFGFSNIYLLQQATDYFGVSAELNGFSHTWSLGVEEQFYLLFPILVWACAPGRSARGAKTLFRLICGLSLLSSVGFLLLGHVSPLAAYFLMPPRFWELGIGCLAFLVAEMKWRPTSVVSSAANPIFLLVAAGGVLCLPLSSNVPGTIAIVLLTASLILVLKPGSTAFQVLTHKGVLYLGLISYSLYLWHWSVIAIVRWVIGIHWWTVPLQLGLMLSLAAFSYHIVETPLRNIRWSNGRSSTIAIGVCGLLVTAALVAGVGKYGATKLFLGEPRAGKMGLDYISPCNDGILENCLARTGVGAHVFLIGDSHATNLVSSLRAASDERGMSLSYFGGVAFVRTIFSSASCDPPACYLSDVDRVAARLGAIVRPGDAVVFSISRNRLFAPRNFEFMDADRSGKESAPRIAYFRDALLRLARAIAAHKASFILVDDVPVVCARLDMMRAAFDSGSCRTSQKTSLSDRRPLTDVYRDVARHVPGVIYLDPHQVFCAGAVCDLMHDGRPIYADASAHIAVENQFILKEFFERNLPRAMGSAAPH